MVTAATVQMSSSRCGTTAMSWWFLPRLYTLLTVLSVTLLLPDGALPVAARRRLGGGGMRRITITMPGRQPLTDEEYAYTSLKVEPGYIRAFYPNANAERVHHMLMYGCTRPAQPMPTWTGHKICAGYDQPKILYAWARNAPELVLPVHVGFPIGHPGDGVDYLVIQVHYAAAFQGDVADYTGVSLDVSEQRPAHLASVYLFVGMRSIPPQQNTFFVNVSCPYPGQGSVTLHPFAYRTHTHALGRVVSAYLKKPDGRWVPIGKRNPQWPQLFEKIDHDIFIQPGDRMFAQCRFNSTEREAVTTMGAHGANEMCNFYMMYSRDANVKDPFTYSACANNQFFNQFSQYPAEGSTLMAPRPRLEMHAHQSAMSFASGGGGADPLPSHRRIRRQWPPPPVYEPQRRRRPYGRTDDVDYWQQQRQPQQQGELQRPEQSVASRQSDGGGGVVRTNDRKKIGPADGRTPPPPAADVPVDEQCVVEKGRWTSFDGRRLGQVAGMAMDPDGRLVIFHRGARVWDYRSFDNSNKLTDRSAIAEDTVLTLDVAGTTPRVFSSFGAGRFYMPHGIFVDHERNIYTTDVGSHQVIKFQRSRENVRQALTLGVQFEPGSDRTHFCQPAAVAVSVKDGAIFVADGYCNSRIVVFTADGRYLDEWGTPSRASGPGIPQPGSFNIPHDLRLDDAAGLVRVADRENARLQTFRLDGIFVDQIRLPEKFDNLYSVDYVQESSTLFMIPGRAPKDATGRIRAFAADSKTQLIKYSFAPKMSSKQQFKAPHVIRADKEGKYIYVGEISRDGGVVSRFEVKREWRKTSGMGGHHHDEGMKTFVRSPQPPSEGDTSAAKMQASGVGAPSGSTSVLRLVFLALSAVLFPTMAAGLVYSCMKQRKKHRHSSLTTFRDGKPLLSMSFGKHNGFAPLSTEDIDGVDDVTTDDEDEEAGEEDTLYSLNKKDRGHAPGARRVAPGASNGGGTGLTARRQSPAGLL